MKRDPAATQTEIEALLGSQSELVCDPGQTSWMADILVQFMNQPDLSLFAPS